MTPQLAVLIAIIAVAGILFFFDLIYNGWGSREDFSPCDITYSLMKSNGESRSPQWPKVRRDFLDKHPKCEACGGTENLEAHHKMPFHINRARELSEDNLIALCEKPGHDCHFVFGHAHDWKGYVPTVEHDALEHYQRVLARRYS